MSGWSPGGPGGQGALGEPGHGVADLEGPGAVGGLDGARADPADVGVAGQAVGGVAPVPDPPGDVAAEQLAPAGLQPLPAEPDPGHQPDPCGRARSEQPFGDCRLLDVHRCAGGTPIGGACHGATRLLSSHEAAMCRCRRNHGVGGTIGHGSNGRTCTGPLAHSGRVAPSGGVRQQDDRTGVRARTSRTTAARLGASRRRHPRAILPARSVPATARNRSDGHPLRASRCRPAAGALRARNSRDQAAWSCSGRS